ncbi:hypothetical protein H9P43_005868 [Blastocladiella emersonii ATCC 22665]|nr:hypothetical protein H9P43_005868 [Blastocladiella emersonii ATCC 22665]
MSLLTSEGRADFRKFLRRSRVARTALTASVVQAVVQVALEAAIAALFLRNLRSVPATRAEGASERLVELRALGEAVSVYHVIYLLAAVGQPLLTLDSIATQNAIQLVAVNVLNVGLLVYSCIQYLQEKAIFDEFRAALVASGPAGGKLAERVTQSAWSLPLQMAAIAVSAVLCFTTAVWAWKLSAEYDWAIYRRVGADHRTRRMLTVYFVLLMLLKLDVFFYFTFALQFLVVLWKQSQSLANIAIHIVVSAAMIVALYLLATRGTRAERRWMMAAFMAGTAGSVAYLAYKLAQVATQDRFMPVRRSLSFAIAGCIALAIVTFGVAAVAVRNFGRGLVAHLDPRAAANAAGAAKVSGDGDEERAAMATVTVNVDPPPMSQVC